MRLPVTLPLPSPLLPLALGLLLGLARLSAATTAAEALPPAVALAPIVRVDPDARPDEPESLTPLIQAALADDPRWRLVERDQLSTLETEWALASSGLADPATAVRQGRLAGASLILLCRPVAGDLSQPSATCEVLDAITAEPLASATTPLSDRPFARWYRNPPPADTRAIAAAFRTALAEAASLRAAQAHRRLLAPLYFTGPAETAARLEAALASALEQSTTWRPRRALRLVGTRQEALLAATGLVADPATLASATGTCLWGRLDPAPSPDAPLTLRYSLWPGTGSPREFTATGDIPALASAILAALETLPLASPSSPADRSTDQLDADAATRLRLARQITEEARAIARSTGLPERFFFFRQPGVITHETERLQCLRLLAAAAFLAPADPDSQELYLTSAFAYENNSTHHRDGHFVTTPEYRRLRREFLHFIDAFWQRPDGSLDLRLLAHAYRSDPARPEVPAFLATLRRHAALIGPLTPEQHQAHQHLFGRWLTILKDLCPEKQKLEDGTHHADLRYGSPRPFAPPAPEVITTFEALWPLFRPFRDAPPLRYPLNLSYFYPPDSPRLGELLADRLPASPAPSPVRPILLTTAPSLFPAPPPAPVAKIAPPAPPPAPPAAPDPERIRRSAERLRAFKASLAGKSESEIDALTRAFFETIRRESAAAQGTSTVPAPPPAPAVPAPPTDTGLLLALDSVLALEPAARLDLLRRACARPGQLALIRALLKAGADPLGLPGDRRPPLLVAIQSRQEDYVHALLDTSPDLKRPWPVPNENGPAGTYLLVHAIERRLLPVAHRLIDLHPEHVKGTPGLDNRDTLLGFALKSGDMPLVRRVIQLGALYSDISDDALIHLARACPRPDAPPEPGRLSFADIREIIRHFQATAPSVINDLEEGESPLLAAVQNRHHDLVEILIAAGADPLRGSFRGENIPTLAAGDPVMQRLLAGQPLARARATPAPGRIDGPALLALYLAKGSHALADIKLTPALLAYQDAKKWTILHHAIERKDEPLALRLIAAGAPLEAASVRGQTPLTFAVFNQRPALVEALLARGADPDGRGDDKATPPLYAAAVKLDLPLMRRLLAAGASPDTKIQDDQLPLVSAIIWNHQGMDTLRLLVEAGARLDLTNHLGYGPLEHAIGKNRADALAYLREKGAAWSRPNDDPAYTPVRFAVKNGARDALLYLLKNGERDPSALALAQDREIRALLTDAMQQDPQSRVALADEELWPAICKDLASWKERTDAHLAAGGDVNYAARSWTPLILAAQAKNLPLVKHLLARGADPRLHPLAIRDKPAFDLSQPTTLILARSGTYNAIQKDEAYYLALLEVLLPLEPSPDHGHLLDSALENRLWTIAETLLRLGVKPFPRAREDLVADAKLKGPDLARALALLDRHAAP